MEANSLQELYIQELGDLYDMEQQIIKALPKMIDQVQSNELQRALTEHLEVTKEQARRIENIFEQNGQKLKPEKCKGIEGIIKEGNDLLKKVEDENLADAAIIGASQKVEHYEMAGYGAVRTWAKMLGEDRAAELLQKTLDEEKEADQKLTELAESSVNLEAAGSEAAPGERTKKTTGSRRRRAA